MAKFRVPRSRDQLTLLPQSIDDFVPASDSVRFVDSFVESLDLSSIESAYSELGRPGYSPQTLVKLLVYGRIRSVRSARELQRASEENLRYIWLLSNEQPDFRTICDFRRRFCSELGDLLRQTIEVGIREKVIHLDQVAVDGTIVRASAGARTLRTRARLEEELSKLDTSFAQDVEADTEREREDDDEPMGGLPEHLRDPQRRRERIRAALDEIEKARDEGRRLKRVSTTDVECRVMRCAGGLKPSYNAQSAVDVESEMIVGAYVTNDVSDGAELAPMLEQVERNTGQNPRVVLADRGYNGYEALRALQERGIDGRIPPVKQRSDVYGPDRFEYDAAADAYGCPGGKTLARKRYDRRTRRTSYVCTDCAGCPHASQCIGMSDRNRTLTVSDDWPLKVAMTQKMNDPEIAASYRIRAGSIEPVFGNVKGNRGMRAFLVRGLRRVSDDWRFEMAVTNLQKLMKIADRLQPNPTAAPS